MPISRKTVVVSQATPLNGLPLVMPAPDQLWTDTSVLEEMALRLRACGGWDNTIADGIAQLKDRIALLERWGRFERHAEDKVRRPLKSWADCRAVLLAITRSRISTFSDIAAPIETCLKLAVWLDRQERNGGSVPSDIRCMMHGAVAVEWEKPYKSIIVQ